MTLSLVKASEVRVGDLKKKKARPKKYKHSAYCEYSHNCDKPIDCMNGDFCSAFRHTKRFTSLREGKDEYFNR